MPRRVPITMATQHPDNAGTPWWKDDPFVATQDEIEEVMLLFKELPIDEYMWDWEGKYVDEAVGEKLFSRRQELFEHHPLGSDLHLTYRIPAFDGEKMHRMARAFMNILALSDLARDIGVKKAPVTEMFLPLTTSHTQPTRIRQAFREIAGHHSAIFHKGKKKNLEILDLFDVTPLVEDVDSLLSIDKIVRPYWERLLKECPEAQSMGQRLFLARSDPAMNAGLVPAVLAVKVALSRAIGFTAALYSVGLPPELISTGRGLLRAQELGLLDMIEKYYPALREDLKHAGKYFNRENLALLAKKKSVFKEIEKDVLGIEKILGISLTPEKARHYEHRELTSAIYRQLRSSRISPEAVTKNIVEAGVIRRSLG